MPLSTHAEQLRTTGVHKQIVNRVLEPWMWTSVIVSSTTYDNFFTLRCHPDAQPEIKRLADLMRVAFEDSRAGTAGRGRVAPAVCRRRRRAI